MLLSNNFLIVRFPDLISNYNNSGTRNHSHKKRKDSLETRAVLIEIFMLCSNLPSSPKHRRWLQKKSITFPEENKLFAGNFVLIWMKKNADGSV